jgi:hypothetical protein
MPNSPRRGGPGVRRKDKRSDSRNRAAWKRSRLIRLAFILKGTFPQRQKPPLILRQLRHG